MKICEDGRAICFIHVPKKPTPVELHASRELKKYLKKMSGISFKVVRGIPDAGPAVVVAEAAHTPLAGQRQMSRESIRRVVDGGRLFLLGADPRGTVTGVYAFLRDELGCVFPQRRASDEYIPKKSTIEVTDEEYYHEPFLPLRYIIGGDDINLLDWSVKAGMSFVGPLLEDNANSDWRGETTILTDKQAEKSVHECIALRGEPGLVVSSHACESIMPPSKYFDEHPEYYAYNPTQKPDALRRIKDGRDSFGICWTNPEVNQFFQKYFLDFFARHPYVTRFTFFPNDGQPPCYCEECRRVEEPWMSDGNDAVQYTKNYVLFAARIARAVAEKFPSVRIEVGSYAGHADLPDDFDEDLPENLDVIFCIIERKWDRALDDPPSNEELHETLDQALVSSYEHDAWKYTQYPHLFAKWRKFVKGEFRYYDYLTSTICSCCMLFPVSRAACRTIRYLEAQGFSGYGSQWVNSPPSWASYGLSLYVTSRTMWDGDKPWEDLAREYCRGFFEGAAEAMFQYFKTLEDSAHKVRFGMGIPEILQIFDRRTYESCRQLLCEARATKVPAKVKRRIRDQETLLEFGHLFWRTRQVEMKIEAALKEDRLSDTFALLAEHLKIDDQIQRLFDRPLLRSWKSWWGVIFRHIMGSLSDRRGILHAVKQMKEAVNAKNRDLWYGDSEKL